MYNLYYPFFILAVIMLISWFNYRLLVRWTPQFRHPVAARCFWVLSGLAFLIIAFAWSTRIFPGLALPYWYRYLAYSSFAWLIAQVIMLIMLPLLFIGHRLAAPVNVPATEGQAAGPLLTRRAFLRDSLIAVPAAALGLSTYGIYTAENALVERRFTLTLPGLPAAYDGLTILQISDTHIGPYFSLSMLDRVIEQARQLAPDVLVITGDLIDNTALLTPAVKKLDALASGIRKGTYYCWGNHEYYRNLAGIRAALKNTAITLIINSHLPISDGKNSLYILGVDYPWAKDRQATKEKCRQFLAQALAGLPTNACKILIAHHPDFLTPAFDAGIPLTLAGHSHGGQIALFGQPVLPLRYDFIRGLYEKNGCYGFVNSGAGHWFPFRLGCPPEIAHFTLRATKA